MKETVDSRLLWHDAGKAGLVLGAAVIIYSLLVSLAGMAGGAFSTVAAFLLWGLKFGGCIFLMRMFLLRLSQRYDGVTSRTAFGYGVRIALLSSLVCSAYALSDAILHPEMIEQVFEMVEIQFSAMLDSNSRSALDRFRQDYPLYIFFGNFIYCFLFGVILARIFSSNLPQADPFGESGGQN